MATVQIDWVNGGVPFEVTPSTPSPKARQSALTVKAHVIRKELAGAKDVPDEAVRAMIASLEPRIFVEMMNVLISDVIYHVDPTLKKMRPDEIQEKLSGDEYVEFVRCLTQAGANPKDAAEASDDPLAQPTPL